MSMNFPDSPSLNDTFSAGSNTWMYDGEKWVLVPEPLNLDDLGDVNLMSTPPVVGDVLTYDGSEWVGAAPTGGGGSLIAGDLDGGILEIDEAEVTNNLIFSFDGGTL